MGEYIISDEQVAENRRLKGKMLLVMPVVVRCRDCRFFRIGTNTDSCAFTDKYARADGYCSWGERREVGR